MSRKICKKCGKCCESLYFGPFDLTNDEKQYYNYHNKCSVIEYRKKTYVKVDAKCDKLKENLCTINETKPIICKRAYSEEKIGHVFMDGCVFYE